MTNIQCVACDKYSMSHVKYNSQVARRSVSSKVFLKSNQGEREVEALVKVGVTIKMFEKTNYDLL